MKPISEAKHEAKESKAEEAKEHRTGKELFLPKKKAAKRGSKRG